MDHHIKLQATTKALSAVGGLSFFAKTFDRLVTSSSLGELLPTTKIKTKCSPLDKFKAMTLGLVAGASCIDDMDRLRQDDGFVAVNGEAVNAARTYDDFLQQFSHEAVRKMNLAMTDIALKLHKTRAKDDDFILAIDSSESEQAGVKIEGVAYNYKKKWCLDTVMAFDQFGFQYHHEVRPGNTFSSNGSPTLIHDILKQVPRNKHRYVLADSAFCNSAAFSACLDRRADFVIACRANMYGPWIPRVRDWKVSKKIKFYDGRKVEIGHTVYVTTGVNKIFRLIVLRASKETESGPTIFQDTRYDYVAFVTTISQHNMADEAVIELYRTRANSENFIKDLKMGFDMYHYPCRNLAANKAYGIMMALAYNLTRYAGYLLSPLKPLFAKAVRFCLVHIPCLVVRHGRSITLKMPLERLEEVRRLYDKMEHSLGYYASS